jgi:Na+-driven multidrug efflux pump
VLLLKFIGGLEQSAAAQAAYTVSYSELFALVTWTASGLMGAAAAVAGQNLGAKQPQRAEAAVEAAARFGLVVAVTLGLAYFFIPGTLLGLFGLREQEVVTIGTQLLRVLSISGLFITVALTYTGGLQGTGDTKSPFYISIISQIVVPLTICFVLRQLGMLQPIGIWIAVLAGHVTRAVLSVWRFRQGKWRTLDVGIATA